MAPESDSNKPFMRRPDVVVELTVESEKLCRILAADPCIQHPRCWSVAGSSSSFTATTDNESRCCCCRRRHVVPDTRLRRPI